MDDQYRLHGAFSWCELITLDVIAAKDFYRQLFGWELEDMSTDGMNYTVIKAGGKEQGGMMHMPGDAPEGMPPVWGVYVTVDDVDSTARTAEKLGAQLIVPPTDIPKVGRFCVIRDPQGAVINAITYRQM